MRLAEIVNEIMEIKFPRLNEKQRPGAFAREIGISEMDIRRAAKVDPGSRRRKRPSN